MKPPARVGTTAMRVTMMTTAARCSVDKPLQSAPPCERDSRRLRPNNEKSSSVSKFQGRGETCARSWHGEFLRQIQVSTHAAWVAAGCLSHRFARLDSLDPLFLIFLFSLVSGAW